MGDRTLTAPCQPGLSQSNALGTTIQTKGGLITNLPYCLHENPHLSKNRPQITLEKLAPHVEKASASGQAEIWRRVLHGPWCSAD